MLKYKIKIKIRQALCSRKSVCCGACRMAMLESRVFLILYHFGIKFLLLPLGFFSPFMVIVFDLCNYGIFIILRMISSGVLKADLISSVMKQMKIQILLTMMARNQG